MRNISAAIAAAVFVTTSLVAQTVTLPLPDYEKLRGSVHSENVTVVDRVRLSGSFRNRDLSATFTGKSVGTRAGIVVFQATSGLSIWGCTGSAIVSRGDDGFRLTPMAESFSATCRIAASGSDRIELTGTRDVLAVESNVVDGELVAIDQSGDGHSRYSLVRQSAGGTETIAPTATGHYLITLLPDETRFRYAIDVHNPNRSRRPFEVRLRSGEHLQQVDAVAPYEIVGGAYRFDIAPGDTTLVLSGQLSGDTFVPPVDATLQYLAIENHPILRPRVDGNVKRISVAEAGVPIQFRGPQAFLLGRGETLRWQKTKLEALHTTSYALTAARHTVFIPADGAALGESIFAVDNQGASDLKMPLRPEPTYVSIGNEPLLMTKGADGKLTIPLSAGRQDILVQHRQDLRHFAGLAIGRLVIPQLTVPASSLFVTLNYPHQWYPLVESFSTRTRIWRPSSDALMIFLALLLWTALVLQYLGLPPRRRILLATAVAVAGAAVDPFAIVIALADAFLTIAWLAPHLKKENWTVLRGVLATGAVIAVIVVIATLNVRRNAYMYSGSGIGALATNVPTDTASESRDAMQLGNAAPPAAPKARQDGNYQGLPARFEIPTGERQSSFGQELLSTDREHAVAVVLVSSSLVWFLGLLLVAFAVTVGWASRAALIAGVRQRIAANGLGPAIAVPSSANV